MLADLPIFGGYEKENSAVAFSSHDVINLFLAKSQGGKKKLAYLATPGLKFEKEIEPGNLPGRELFKFSDILYGAFGSSIYRLQNDLVPDYIGSIGTSTGYVSIQANNANQIAFVDGNGFYLYKTSDGSFTKVPGEDDCLALPLNVGILDGYFIVPLANSRQFQISTLNNGSEFLALDEAQIQRYPGLNVGCGVVNQRIYFFKTDSTEVWYNAGQADFPFRPDGNLLFNFGCKCTQSIRSAFGYLFWLASDQQGGVGSVMVTTGNDPKRISTDEIDDLISTFVAPSDMDAYIYKQNGHIFYQMSWTTDDVTLFYDVTMDQWYRKAMLKTKAVRGVPYSGKVRHVTSCHAYFNGQHIVGSYKDSKLYSMSRDYPDNAGEPMPRQFVTDHFFDPINYRMLQINSITLDIQAGIGESGLGYNTYTNPNDDGLINPQMYLAISRDGAASYGNDIPQSMGKIGERRARAIWRKKGQGRTINCRFTIYAPLRDIAILGGSINYEVLSK